MSDKSNATSMFPAISVSNANANSIANSSTNAVNDERPVAVVIGATGAQGGSVARALLADGRYAVRAITRRPQSQAAQTLRNAGAYVLPGDLSEKATLQDLMAGARVVFGVTSFWEHFAGEYAQGRNLIEVLANSPTLEHFIFSSQPFVLRATGGLLSVPHFDIKAKLESETRDLGLPATFVHLSFYYENVNNFYPAHQAQDGAYVFTLPLGDAPLAAVSVDELGGVVNGILARRREYLGRTVAIAGDEQPMSAYAQSMTDAFGRTFRFEDISARDYATLGFPGSEEIAAMFDYYKRFAPARRSAIAESRALAGGMKTFAQWVTQRARTRGSQVAA